MARKEKDRLADALRRLVRRGSAGVAPQGPGLAPPTPFDALLEARIRALERQVEEVKGRVNGLFFLLLGSLAVEVVLRLLR